MCVGVWGRFVGCCLGVGVVHVWVGVHSFLVGVVGRVGPEEVGVWESWGVGFLLGAAVVVTGPLVEAEEDE